MKYLIVLAASLLAVWALTDDEKQTFVDVHNSLRSKHDTGPLEWDDTVADFAQKWCDKISGEGNMKHSKGSGYGENLYWSSVQSGDGQPAKATNAWYNEIKDYDFNNPGFSSATGHFTQVICSLLKYQLTLEISTLIQGVPKVMRQTLRLIAQPRIVRIQKFFR